MTAENNPYGLSPKAMSDILSAIGDNSAAAPDAESNPAEELNDEKDEDLLIILRNANDIVDAVAGSFERPHGALQKPDFLIYRLDGKNTLEGLTVGVKITTPRVTQLTVFEVATMHIEENLFVPGRASGRIDYIYDATGLKDVQNLRDSIARVSYLQINPQTNSADGNNTYGWTKGQILRSGSLEDVDVLDEAGRVLDLLPDATPVGFFNSTSGEYQAIS